MNKRQWIPATEALPGHAERVLVVCNNPQNHMDLHISISECYRYSGQKIHWSRGYKVTHWMPLPDMPEEIKDA